jgi:tetratricopeptide (TPR) repeat protein
MSATTTASGFSVWFWRQIATWAVIFKRTDLAIEFWARIHAARPRDPLVLSALAHLHAEKGRNAEAVALLRHSLEIDPGKAATWFNLAFLLQSDNEHQAAIEAFDRAIAIDDKLDRAHYGKALSLIKQGCLEDSIPCLKRNIELQPMSPFGFYQLVHVYHRLGQTGQAEEMIRHLAGFEPQVARQLERETGISAGLEAL